MPEPLFDSLFQRTATLTWPPVDNVRRRARKRSRRQWVASTIAVAVAVAVVGAGGAAVFARDDRAQTPGTSNTIAPTSTTPEPSPTPESSSPPGPPQIVTAAMLQPSDLGSGTTVEEVLGDWNLGFTLSLCPKYRLSLSGTKVAGDVRRLQNNASGEGVIQSLAVYQPGGDAERDYLAYRVAVLACASFEIQFDPGPVFTIDILDEGFAGDRSMLVEVKRGSAYRALHVYLQKGDFVTELVPVHFVTKPATEQFSREMARKAVARVCAAEGC